LLEITCQDTVTDGFPFGPAIPFGAIAIAIANADGDGDRDGAEVAHGDLMARSWMGDETGRLVNVRWTEGNLEAARLLLAAILEAAAPGDELNAASNADVHPDSAERIALFESVGFELWQEKEGFWWSDEGQDLPAPDRVVVRTPSDIGTDRFLEIFTASAAGTLDRIDADTIAEMGHAAWAAAFFAASEDTTWLLAENPEGDIVGFVGIDESDLGVGTITHITVLPDHCGNGYVDQLLRVANRTARELGFGAMLSDSDTLNAPMHAALRRNGHSPEATAWHKWMHRRKV
jgi:RimJ/RimL family protein N-acetyltransferase